jgi:hypothetical protein
MQGLVDLAKVAEINNLEQSLCLHYNIILQHPVALMHVSSVHIHFYLNATLFAVTLLPKNKY